MTHGSPEDAGAVSGTHARATQQISLRTRDGYITDVLPATAAPGDGSPWIVPGLVDLQVNGYGGVDFNAPSLHAGHVLGVTRSLWREGVTSYFPTIITNDDRAIKRAIITIERARAQDDLVRSSVAGIHLEGPFISPEDGPRGAHDAAYVRAPDWQAFQRWQDASGGNIRLITLSPEWPGSADFITRCVDSGVKVSIGHTAATTGQIREAVAAGAGMSTHLGNGAHPMLPRHPNYIWDQLAEDQLWASIIADGFHLPASVLKVVLGVKEDRAMLVSDVVSFSGMEPGEYETHVGGRVVLTPEGKLHLVDNPRLLAGSARVLREGVAHLVNSRLCDLLAAWTMASTRPASFIRLPQAAGLSVGAPADFVVFSWSEGGIEIIKTYKRGQLVYDVSGDSTEER